MNKQLQEKFVHKETKVLLFKDYSCEFFSQGKLICKLYMIKVDYESSFFLQKIQTDICESIQPTSGLFK